MDAGEGLMYAREGKVGGYGGFGKHEREEEEAHELGAAVESVYWEGDQHCSDDEQVRNIRLSMSRASKHVQSNHCAVSCIQTQYAQPAIVGPSPR